jgi:hypothetical protein
VLAMRVQRHPRAPNQTLSRLLLYSARNKAAASVAVNRGRFKPATAAWVHNPCHSAMPLGKAVRVPVREPLIARTSKHANDSTAKARPATRSVTTGALRVLTPWARAKMVAESMALGIDIKDTELARKARQTSCE